MNERNITVTKAPVGRSALAKTGQTGQHLTIADDRNAALFDHAGEGTERVGINDIILPRLKILQALSPEVNRRNPDYIPGAEPGLILNVATRKLYSSILAVPATYMRHHIEWRPNRGGFVRDHGDNEAIMSRVTHRDDKSFDILPGGNLIVPTPTWYVILVAATLPGEHPGEDGEVLAIGDPAIISMPRTQSKASRQWMAQATSEKLNHPEKGQFQAPLFYRSWRLSTVETSNDQGTWFVFNVTPEASVTDTVDPSNPEAEMVLPADTMHKAIRFRDQVVGGIIRADASHFGDDDFGGGRSGQREDEQAPM